MCLLNLQILLLWEIQLPKTVLSHKQYLQKNEVFPLCAIFWYSAQLWFEYLVFVLERFTIRNFKLKKTKGCRNDKINKYYWNGSQLMENQTNNSMQGFCATFLAFQLVDSQLMRTVLSEKSGVLLNQNMRNIRLSFFSHMPCFHISPLFLEKMSNHAS